MATLRAHGRKYSYAEHGSKDAPCVVLSPFVYSEASVYEPLIRILEDDYRVITYDFRSWGYESYAVRPSLESSVKDVASLIEQLGAEPCHFVGIGLGVEVGLRLAQDRPELIKSCILSGVLAENEHQRIHNAVKEWASKSKMADAKAINSDFAKLWFGDTFRATKDPIQASRRENWMSHFHHLKPEDLEFAEKVLHHTKPLNLQCATLVLGGAEDSSSNLELCRQLAKDTEGEFQIIHHAGFAAVVEQPEEVAECIRTFVGEVEHQQRQDLLYSTDPQSRASIKYTW